MLLLSRAGWRFCTASRRGTRFCFGSGCLCSLTLTGIHPLGVRHGSLIGSVRASGRRITRAAGLTAAGKGEDAEARQNGGISFPIKHKSVLSVIFFR